MDKPIIPNYGADFYKEISGSSAEPISKISDIISEPTKVIEEMVMSTSTELFFIILVVITVVSLFGGIPAIFHIVLQSDKARNDFWLKLQKILLFVGAGLTILYLFLLYQMYYPKGKPEYFHYIFSGLIFIVSGFAMTSTILKKDELWSDSTNLTEKTYFVFSLMIAGLSIIGSIFGFIKGDYLTWEVPKWVHETK